MTVRRTVSEAAFKAAARTIPYDELKKDPAAPTGTAVHYRAKIFQYDSSTGTSAMLLEVMAGSYGHDSS